VTIACINVKGASKRRRERKEKPRENKRLFIHENEKEDAQLDVNRALDSITPANASVRLTL
jgi:hypothetical protein